MPVNDKKLIKELKALHKKCEEIAKEAGFSTFEYFNNKGVVMFVPFKE